VRKWTALVVIALAAVGVVIAVIPFDPPAPRGSYPYTQSFLPGRSCAAPIVSAWRHQPENSGWFGYAPLTAIPESAVSCKEPARRRLAYAALLACPGLVVLFFRRRRFGTASGQSFSPS
jgi:hypothetical protein